MLLPAGTQVTFILKISQKSKWVLNLKITKLFFPLGSDWAMAEAKHNLVTKYLGAHLLSQYML
jgi:hypothetical protein